MAKFTSPGIRTQADYRRVADVTSTPGVDYGDEDDEAGDEAGGGADDGTDAGWADAGAAVTTSVSRHLSDAERCIRSAGRSEETDAFRAEMSMITSSGSPVSDRDAAAADLKRRACKHYRSLLFTPGNILSGGWWDYRNPWMWGLFGVVALGGYGIYRYTRT